MSCFYFFISFTRDENSRLLKKRKLAGGQGGRLGPLRVKDRALVGGGGGAGGAKPPAQNENTEFQMTWK